MINHGYHFDRNLIIVPGPFASGKTHTIGKIQDFFFDHNLWYDKPITDSVYIEEALEADHRYNDGVNHMHEGQKQPEKHKHYPGEPNLQFSVTGSYIPDWMFTRFFHDLSRDWPKDKLYVVEWGGGVNTNAPEHPASHADYSFTTHVERLRSGVYDTGWLSHVLMVIHPMAPDGAFRAELNDRRKGRDPTRAEIEAGMRSWFIPEAGMNITGHNDFLDVIPTLENMGLSGRIHVISNDGSNEYDRELRRILDENIGPLLYKEGQRPGPEGNHSASTRDRSRR